MWKSLPSCGSKQLWGNCYFVFQETDVKMSHWLLFVFWAGPSACTVLLVLKGLCTGTAASSITGYAAQTKKVPTYFPGNWWFCIQFKQANPIMALTAKYIKYNSSSSDYTGYLVFTFVLTYLSLWLNAYFLRRRLALRFQVFPSLCFFWIYFWNLCQSWPLFQSAMHGRGISPNSAGRALSVSAAFNRITLF